MDKITAVAAVARLRRAGWGDFKFKNGGITMRHERATRHVAYVDTLGSMVAARDVLVLEREARLRNDR